MFRVHCCLLDKECRDYGAPPRLYMHAGNWHLTIALGPDGRSQHYNSKTKMWEGWHWITLYRRGATE